MTHYRLDIWHDARFLLADHTDDLIISLYPICTNDNQCDVDSSKDRTCAPCPDVQ